MNIRYMITIAFMLGAVAVGSSDTRAADAGAPNWLLTLAPSPIARGGHAMAYDSARDRVVLFGGYHTTHYVPLGDTWEWDGSVWVERTPVIGPSARSGHAMAYDSARGRVVLFGGYGDAGDLGDTWEWDGRNWVERTPATSPPACQFQSMVYDSVRSRSLLFTRCGGTSPGTWEWDGSDWVERTPANGPPYLESMAYDSARGRAVLFGPSGSTSHTWEWDGDNWSLRTPPTSPPVSYLKEAMAYDSARGRVVLFGGSRDHTWEWDGDNWTLRTPPASPLRRYAHAMVYHGAKGRVLMFGGELGAYFFSDEIWEWDGAVWVRNGPLSRAASAMAYDGGRNRVLLFGGAANHQHCYPCYLGDTWELDERGWIQRAPATSPTARAFHAMTYDEARGRVVLFGGSDAGRKVNDTWEWDGNTWIQRTPPTSPPARRSSTMVYDSARGRAVLFGGDSSSGALGDTWEWDGNTWMQRTPAMSPPACATPAMAYDRAHGRTMLWCGPSSGTWEWDGSNWVERTPVTSPPAYSPTMVYDSARSRVVLFGGYGFSGDLDDTWEWDGNNWVVQLPSTSPRARYAHTMVYDHARNRVILFGGGDGDVVFGDMWEYGPIDACGHAASIAAFTPGSGTGDASALASLGGPDGVAVSLGLGGSVELQLQRPIHDGPGADFAIRELGVSEESYRLEASEDGIEYFFAGDCSGTDCQVDLGRSGLPSASFVKVTDLPPDDGEPAPDAGADIDAVSIVACSECLLGPDFDGDDTANACDDCPEHADPTQTDMDGDGAGDACDCAPSDALARPAEEVGGLAVAKLGAGALRLSWNAAAGAATYAVVRGELSTLSAMQLGDCVAGEIAALVWEDAELTLPGRGFTYLVRGESPLCGAGTLGFGAFGAPRGDTGGACP